MLWQEKEAVDFWRRAERLSESCVARTAERNALIEKLKAPCAAPILLTGEAGAGKSVLMSAAAVYLREEGVLSFPYVCGYGPREESGHELLRQFLYALGCALGEPDDALGDTDALWDALKGKIARYGASGRPLLVLMADGPERLPDGAALLEAFLSVGPLPDNLRVALFTRALPEAGANAERIALMPLDAENRRLMLRRALHPKKIYLNAKSMDALLRREEAGNPLYLALLLKYLSGQSEEELVYADETIQEAPGNLSELGCPLLAESDERVVSLIASSSRGLRPDDLRAVFSIAGWAWDETLLPAGPLFSAGADGRIDFSARELFAPEPNPEAESLLLERLRGLGEGDPVYDEEYARLLTLCGEADELFRLLLTAEGGARDGAARVLAREALKDGGYGLLNLLKERFHWTEKELRVPLFLTGPFAEAFPEDKKSRRALVGILIAFAQSAPSDGDACAKDYLHAIYALLAGEYSALGEYPRARAAAEEALGLSEGIPGAEGDMQRARDLCAVSAIACLAGDEDAEEKYAYRAVCAAEAAAKSAPEKKRRAARRELSLCLTRLADVYHATGDARREARCRERLKELDAQ